MFHKFSWFSLFKKLKKKLKRNNEKFNNQFLKRTFWLTCYSETNELKIKQRGALNKVTEIGRTCATFTGFVGLLADIYSITQQNTSSDLSSDGKKTSIQICKQIYFYAILFCDTLMLTNSTPSLPCNAWYWTSCTRDTQPNQPPWA